MSFQEHSLDDQIIAAKPLKKQQKAKIQENNNWIKSLFLGALVAVVALFLTFVINSSFPGSFLIVPLGTILSVFLGSLVFLVGNFLSDR